MRPPLRFPCGRTGFGMRLTLAALLPLLLALAACADSGASQCQEGLEPGGEHKLFFGLGDSISESEWDAFLADVITPRFPGGLTVLDAYGQWQPPVGDLVRQPTKVLLIGGTDLQDPDHWKLIREIAAEWEQRYGVPAYHLTTESCSGFL